jgi:hypothetical protein
MITLHSKFLVMIGLVAAFASASIAFGGTLISPGVSWSNFVFEPVDNEATPNYYGYGAKLTLGYSVDQVWDLGFYGQYIPGKLKAASTINPDATVMSYGLETALRVNHSLYLGVRGGPTTYHLLRHVEPEQVDGEWEGLSGSAMLGLILPASKQVFWQFTAEYGTASLRRKDLDLDSENRRLSIFSVMLSFVLNSDQSTRLDNILLRNWF